MIYGIEKIILLVNKIWVYLIQPDSPYKTAANLVYLVDPVSNVRIKKFKIKKDLK